MSTRQVVNHGLFGFLVGYGLRRGFDLFNEKMIIKKYEETGEIPQEKSLLLSIFLVALFGSFGLFYISPRTAIPFVMIEAPLMLLLFLGIFVRPFALFVAFVATISYNKTIQNVFGRHRR